MTSVGWVGLKILFSLTLIDSRGDHDVREQEAKVVIEARRVLRSHPRPRDACARHYRYTLQMLMRSLGPVTDSVLASAAVIEPSAILLVQIENKETCPLPALCPPQALIRAVKLASWVVRQELALPTSKMSPAAPG